MNQILYPGNNNVVQITPLTNSVTSAIDTGATVTLTIKTVGGVNVSGESWPLTMNHDTGALYRATVSENLAIVANRMYIGHVEVTGTGGEIGHFECELMAQGRGCL